MSLTTSTWPMMLPRSRISEREGLSIVSCRGSCECKALCGRVWGLRKACPGLPGTDLEPSTLCTRALRVESCQIGQTRLVFEYLVLEMARDRRAVGSPIGAYKAIHPALKFVSTHPPPSSFIRFRLSLPPVASSLVHTRTTFRATPACS
jgi:hypothetical protein